MIIWFDNIDDWNASRSFGRANSNWTITLNSSSCWSIVPRYLAQTSSKSSTFTPTNLSFKVKWRWLFKSIATYQCLYLFFTKHFVDINLSKVDLFRRMPHDNSIFTYDRTDCSIAKRKSKNILHVQSDSLILHAQTKRRPERRLSWVWRKTSNLYTLSVAHKKWFVDGER